MVHELDQNARLGVTPTTRGRLNGLIVRHIKGIDFSGYHTEEKKRKKKAARPCGARDTPEPLACMGWFATYQTASRNLLKKKTAHENTGRRPMGDRRDDETTPQPFTNTNDRIRAAEKKSRTHHTTDYVPNEV